jgi:hypothetical protein
MDKDEQIRAKALELSILALGGIPGNMVSTNGDYMLSRYQDILPVIERYIRKDAPRQN